jgi:hypothetical protein
MADRAKGAGARDTFRVNIKAVGLRVLLAIAVALGVPVSQLRTPDTYVTCCCPDPANCHCPDHKPDHSGQPKMRACHKVQHELVSAQAPSFTQFQVAIAIAPPIVAPVHFELPSAPHPTPLPDEPYGPS